MIRTISLMKRYSKRKRPAVHDLTFGVGYGECFGLLGVNGAGKTTTFNMLTTGLRPNKGEIWMNNQNMALDAAAVYDKIGYCPQFDALLPLLTGWNIVILNLPMHTCMVRNPAVSLSSPDKSQRLFSSLSNLKLVQFMSNLLCQVKSKTKSVTQAHFNSRSSNVQLTQ